MASKLEQATATGLIQAGPLFLKSATLSSAAGAASSAVFEDTSGGGGTALLKLSAVTAGGSSAWRSGDTRGALFSTGLYVTISGASAVVSVEYEQ